jgi:acylphosphatase
MAIKVRNRVVIEGVVQGVSFRTAVRDFALENSVRGWVKNRQDGRVEAVLEGDNAQVEKVVNFCRRGPGSAMVLRIEVMKEPYKNEYFGFTIKSDKV